MKQVAILGATGSIGASTLTVLRANPSDYQVFGLTGYHQLDKLLTLCQEFKPKVVCVPATRADAFAKQLAQANLNITLVTGEQGLVDLATATEVDTVMAAIVGAAGLPATLAAVQAGKRVLLANKEALVMAGSLMMQAAQQSGAQLLPVDSEHNAIFQCLPADVQTGQMPTSQAGIRQLWLTASGGPFRDRTFADMQAATPAQACNHPNWSMGQKISVDSATMMNKGLEFIEACHLFAMSPEKVQVVVHPQSIVHSLVEYIDGSFLAQLGSPDMCIPIAHALAFPERSTSGAKVLNLFELSQLEFYAPDLQKFYCLTLAQQAMQAGGTAPVWLNAANEVAVAAFLNQRIKLTDIATVIERVLTQQNSNVAQNLQDLLAADEQARHIAKQEVNACPF